MKLHATVIPYSGTVGSGGLQLIDEEGRPRFMVAIIGTKGITKEQTAAISKALIDGIPDPIEVPEGRHLPEGKS